MIDYDKLKLNDHLLHTNAYSKIWLGKIIKIHNENHESYLLLQCMYSNAYYADKKYAFYKHMCEDERWSIPSDEQLKSCYKLMVFQ